MQELEWKELVNGESDVDADDINKLAKYMKELNENKPDKNDVTIDIDDKLSVNSLNPVQNKVVTKALDEKVDKEDGKGLSSNDFTDALKTRLENNTFDYYHSLEYPNDFEVEFENLLNECTDEGVHLIFVRESDDTISHFYILTVGTYTIFEDDIETFCHQSLFNLINGTLKVRDGIGSEWQKISVSQTDLNKAIGDVEASLDNIIKKYGLGGDGV